MNSNECLAKNSTNGVILNLNHDNSNETEITQFVSNDSKVSKINSLPKTVTLSWRSVNVKVSLQKCFKKKESSVILKDIHGLVEPRRMCCLMGAR